MKDSTDAIRYARALESALSGDAEVEKTADELAAVATVLAADPETGAFLTGPAADPSLREGLVATLIASLGLSAPTANFLKLLSQRGHLELLPDAAGAMARIRDRRLGIVEAEVTSAAPLDEDLVGRTRTTLEKATGRKVRLSFKTDPALIGGIVARVDGTVFDGSVRARLDAMRTYLARA